jgi:hypothetical protein
VNAFLLFLFLLFFFFFGLFNTRFAYVSLVIACFGLCARARTLSRATQVMPVRPQAAKWVAKAAGGGGDD